MLSSSQLCLFHISLENLYLHLCHRCKLPTAELQSYVESAACPMQTRWHTQPRRLQHMLDEWAACHVHMTAKRERSSARYSAKLWRVTTPQPRQQNCSGRVAVQPRRCRKTSLWPGHEVHPADWQRHLLGEFVGVTLNHGAIFGPAVKWRWQAVRAAEILVKGENRLP